MKTIAVIGTGPAGISAAHELARSGFNVVVFEKSSTIGGKVTSYREAGKSYEHGIHGWWNNYRNFDRLLADNGIGQDIFKRAMGTHMVTNVGRKYALNIMKYPIPSPLFMAWQTLTAPYLSIWDALSLIRFGIVLFGFDHAKDYEKYDKLSFQELLDECRVSKRVQDLMLKPFILSFDFTVPARVSAACGLSGMHFYVIRDRMSVSTRWLKGTPNDLVFEPIRATLERVHGVRFMPSAKVNALAFNPDATVTVRYEASNDAPAGEQFELARFPVAELPANSFVKLAGHNVLVGQLQGQIVAYDNTCSHNGCSVQWAAASGVFECPCHGGKYSVQGAVIAGPPPRGLRKYRTEVNGTDVVVLATQPLSSLVVDDVVLATDVLSARHIMADSLPVTHAVNYNLAKLDTTPVIAVRLWFKAKNYEPAIDSAITPEYAFIDNYFNLNSFSEAYDAQGHVVEVQAYRVFGELSKTDQEILELALRDLSLINASYNQANLETYVVNRHHQLFTRYAPGLNEARPTEQSGVPGLYFAGDWTRFDYPVWMMERGISSGIRAANAICDKYGAAKREPIRLDKGGLLFRLTQRCARILLKIQETQFTALWRSWTGASRPTQVAALPKTKSPTGLYFQKPAEQSWGEWLVFLLQTAAEIEHSLMVQYLYAGYSITPSFGTSEYDMLVQWKSTVLGVAVEEMGHLMTVQSILALLQAPVNFEREDYPFRSEFYPFPFSLEPFSKASLAKYIIAEMPEAALTEELKVILGQAQVASADKHINSIGLLYQDIIAIVTDGDKIPDNLLRHQPSRAAAFRYWSFAKDLICEDVVDRTAVVAVLQRVAEQGEGLTNHDNSHFERFLSIYREFDLLDQGRLDFVSARVHPDAKLRASSAAITEPRAALWARALNCKYSLTLYALTHLLDLDERLPAAYVVSAQRELSQLIHHEMSGKQGKGGIKQIAERLFSLPHSQTDLFGLRAGPTFELPSSLAIPARETERWLGYQRLCVELKKVLEQLVDFESEREESKACLPLCTNILDRSAQHIAALS